MAISAYQVFVEKAEKPDMKYESLFTITKFLMDLSIEEIQTIILKETKFEFEHESYDCFFGNFDL